MSLVLREPPALLPLAAAVAVAEVCGPGARVKWPNDVRLEGRKVAGILAEGRPQEGWAVLGIGLNVAVRVEELPEDLRSTAATLGRDPEALPRVLQELLAALARALELTRPALLEAWRSRDALRGRAVSWTGGEGIAQGVDGDGRLLVEQADGRVAPLDAGEVHLRSE